MEYFRYKCWCTLHTDETLLVGVENSEYILVGYAWHIQMGS